MTQTLVQRLAQWTLNFEMSAVDRSAVERMKHSVLDALGCGILTLDEDCVRGVLTYAKDLGGTAQASMLGGGEGPLTLVTLVNTTLIRAIDFNDHLALDPNTGAKRGGHPSDNLSAILAVAEWRNLPGKAVMAALLASYEIYGRVYPFLTPELPWDHTTAFSLSVPAVAARLLGLTAEKAANAIAISAEQSITLGVVRRGQLSHSKFLASPLNAERGVQSAQLAAAGVTGPMTLFEDRRGFANGVFRTDRNIEQIVAPFEGRHMIDGVTIKAFPGMDTVQAAAEAAVKAVAGRKLRAEDIVSVELVINDHPMAREQASDAERRAPHSRETADHSFFYIIAVALLDGEVTPRQFSEGRWLEPEVCDLMNRMSIKNDAGLTKKAPGGFPCIIELKTRDGDHSVVEVDFAGGHARNKMSRAQVVNKFRNNVAKRLNPVRADEIIAAVDSLDDLTSIRELTRLLT